MPVVRTIRVRADRVRFPAPRLNLNRRSRVCLNLVTGNYGLMRKEMVVIPFPDKNRSKRVIGNGESRC